MRGGITDVFDVSAESDKGRRVVNFCAEMGQCVGNKYLEHKSLHKYARVAREQDKWR